MRHKIWIAREAMLCVIVFCVLFIDQVVYHRTFSFNVVPAPSKLCFWLPDAVDISYVSESIALLQ